MTGFWDRQGLRPRLLLAMAAYAMLIPVIASGDWITLKTGGRITGTIIRQSPKEITIEDDHGALLTFQVKQVEEFYVNHRPADEATLDCIDDSGETDESAEAKDGDESSAPEVVLSERVFGDCTLKLPQTYVLKRERMKFEGHNGELMGLCEEAATGVMLSVSASGLVAGTKNFSEMMALSKQYFADEKRCTVLRWERCEQNGFTGICAELEGPKTEASKIFLFLWVPIRADFIYAVNITVLREHFTRDPDLYRGIMRSFRYRQPGTEASARTAVQGPEHKSSGDARRESPPKKK